MEAEGVADREVRGQRMLHKYVEEEQAARLHPRRDAPQQLLQSRTTPQLANKFGTLVWAQEQLREGPQLIVPRTVCGCPDMLESLRILRYYRVQSPHSWRYWPGIVCKRGSERS